MKISNSVTLLFAFLVGIKVVAQPSIQSFSPESGPIGTVVTIIGNNFNNTTAGNTVYFGAAKGSVLSASVGSINVLVPYGASYQPITVTSSNLTAYSAKPFNVTFKKDTVPLNAGMFSPQTDLISGGSVNGIATGDFNGDGQPDIVTANYDSGTISVFQNTTTSNLTSFSSKINYRCGQGASNVAIGDIDGDGKLDIAVTNYGVSTISVFRNITTTSDISFSSKYDFSTESLPVGIAIRDIDLDGKPDIAVTCYNAKTLSVFKNTSPIGDILFDPGKNYITEINPWGLAIGDLDSDGKPDIAVANYGGNTISVYRNNSSSSISLDAKIDIPAGSFPSNLVISDLDGDGKQDIGLTNFTNSATISILQNVSSVGVVSFKPKISYPCGSNPLNISVSDLTGDGLPDIVTANSSSNNFSFFKNNSTPGVIFLNPKNDLNCNGTPYALSIVDLNADGNPDIATANFSSKSASLFINEIDKTHITSIIPSIGGNGTVVTITGRNFNNITGVQFGDIPAQSFTVQSPSTITAKPGGGASGFVTVLSLAGSYVSSDGFQYVQTPAISSISPDSGTTGSQILIQGTNLNYVTSITFGGRPATSFLSISSTQLTAYVGFGASGNIEVATSGGTTLIAGFKFTGPEITSFSPETAGSGDTVTIKGKKFKNVTSVSLGETGVPYTVIDSTTIKAVVDTGSTGSIKVITQGGTIEKDGFTYLGPSISFFNPSRGGSGKTITIKGINFIGTTAVSFGGVAALSFTVVSPTKITAVLGAGNSGNISVTNNYGIATVPGFNFIPPPHILSFNPHDAGPGTTVTITGTNFIDVDSVKFGNISTLRFTNSSADTIKATIGNAVSGKIKIVTTGGFIEVDGFNFIHPPIINSFTPESGSAGSTVLINGDYFNSSTQANIVYFGAVKAVVTNASASQLAVTVPDGATFEPITVSSNTLMAYSKKPFKVLLADSFNVFLKSSFDLKIVPNAGVYINSISAKDFNDDGKPEFGVANTNHFNLLLNKSLPKKIQFENQVENSFGYGNSLKSVDIDGDGKNDIAVVKANTLSIFRNISTGTNIVFDNSRDFYADPLAFKMGIGDIDNDGKSDIVVTNLSSNTLSIFRNNSYPGQISFDPKVDLPTGRSPRNIIVTDLDGDHFPDILFVNSESGTLSIIKNNSTPGIISLLPRGDYATNSYPESLSVGDLNNDNKPDIAVSYSYADKISIFKNLSTIGVPVLDEKIDLPAETNPDDVALSDLDGDGLTDIIVSAPGLVSLYKNLGLAGNNFTFADRMNLNSNIYSSNRHLAVADFDGDNKQDIGLTVYSNYDVGVYIFRNQLGEPNASAICNNDNTTFTSNRTGSNYQWQNDTGTGFTNLLNSANYSGVNSNSLQLIGMPSSSYGYEYRCVVDGVYSYVFSLKFSNIWYGTFSNAWENPLNWSCHVVPDSNTDVIIEGGNISINSDVTVRSIAIKPSAVVTIETGHNLTVLQ